MWIIDIWLPSFTFKKKSKMKTLHSFTILLALAVLSCQPRMATTTNESDIPKLLNRPHVIGPEEEMGYVMDAYEKLTQKLSGNPTDAEALISLTELFMQEARITGEHGYYYP